MQTYVGFIQNFCLSVNPLFFVLLSPQNNAFMVYYQIYRTDGSFSQPPFNRKGGTAMRIVFLIGNYRCMRFSRPLPDTGYMTGTGIFCAVSIKKGHCYKNFREQDMA